MHRSRAGKSVRFVASPVPIGGGLGASPTAIMEVLGNLTAQVGDIASTVGGLQKRMDGQDAAAKKKETAQAAEKKKREAEQAAEKRQKERDAKAEKARRDREAKEEKEREAEAAKAATGHLDQSTAVVSGSRLGEGRFYDCLSLLPQSTDPPPPHSALPQSTARSRPRSRPLRSRPPSRLFGSRPTSRRSCSRPPSAPFCS